MTPVDSGFAKVTLDDQMPALLVSSGGGATYFVGISVDAVPAWRSWLAGTDAIYADDLLAVAEDLGRAECFHPQSFAKIIGSRDRR